MLVRIILEHMPDVEQVPSSNWAQGEQMCAVWHQDDNKDPIALFGWLHSSKALSTLTVTTPREDLVQRGTICIITLGLPAKFCAAAPADSTWMEPSRGMFALKG